MRHRVHGHKLGRTGAHRKAMFRNQLEALFTHERIVTTLTKAKALRPLAERMVTLARTGSLSARRQVLRSMPDKEVVARLFDDIAPRFVDRPGGYTRIMRMGRRHGDGAELAIIELVDYTLEKKQEGGEKKASLMDRAKGMFGGGRKAEEPTGAEEQPQEQEAAAEAEEAPEEKPKKAKAPRKPAPKKAKAKDAEAAQAEAETAAEGDEAPDEGEPAAGDEGDSKE